MDASGGVCSKGHNSRRRTITLGIVEWGMLPYVNSQNFIDMGVWIFVGVTQHKEPYFSVIATSPFTSIYSKHTFPDIHLIICNWLW